VRVWWTQIPRLLPRVARLEFFFRSMKMDLNVHVPWLQLFELSLGIGLSAHWIGCFYYTISRAQGFSEETWVFRLETIIPGFTMGGSTISYRYLLCLSKVPLQGHLAHQKTPRLAVRGYRTLDTQQGFDSGCRTFNAQRGTLISSRALKGWRTFRTSRVCPIRGSKW